MIFFKLISISRYFIGVATLVRLISWLYVSLLRDPDAQRGRRLSELKDLLTTIETIVVPTLYKSLTLSML